MRVLIVKLSSLGDVVHAMPVVNDIRAAHPGAQIDWVVEPGFAPLVRRIEGIGEVIECALRRWRKAWWTAAVRSEWRVFKARLQHTPFDAVIDLQGLTKSALIARLAKGPTHGIANRTEGSGFEWPAALLVQNAVQVPQHTHALDRARLVAGQALGYTPHGAPRFGLRAVAAPPPADARPTLVLVHGTSRDDKLWPEDRWIEIGHRAIAEGWLIALPHAGAHELERAQRLAAALGSACTVWPAMNLDAMVDCLGATQGVIGVDSGLSHIAVALDLRDVQLYNFATAWRTGPLAAHGHLHQEACVDTAMPAVDVVWAAWLRVRAAAVPANA
jgi:heptosyltransferase-1